jgi:PAS domain S-box-containing protein
MTGERSPRESEVADGNPDRALLDRIFATSPVGLLVTDADGEIVRANRQARVIFGRPDRPLSGHRFGETAARFRTASGDVVPESELPVGRVLATGEPVDDREFELELEDGRTRWVSVSATPLTTADGTVERVTVAIEDIDGRKDREQSLRSFQKAIQHAGHSMYFTDTDGTIQYVNPTFERSTGYSAEEAIGRDPNILASGDHDESFYADLWETIRDGEVWTGEVVNERKSGEQYVINQTIAPIVDESGTIEQFVAVNDDITEQKRRERTLRRQRNSLERIQQIIESLRPINRELARVSTRPEIDRLVCDQLATSEAYLFAWLGEYNQATDEITPREWAGVEEGFVRSLELTVDDTDAGGPFEQAVADRAVQVRQEIPTDPSLEERRDRAIEYGFQSVAAIPVMYGETVLGVIGVYSARPNAFDKYEQELLRELGERIGHAINAAENKQLLYTDTVVELAFEVGSDSVLATLTAELECRLTVNNVTPTTSGAYLCHIEVDGADPETVGDTVEEHTDVEHARAVRAHGQTGIVEVAVTSGPIVSLLEHGASVRSFEASEGSATLRGETTPQSDVRTIITDLEASHPETVFLAKQTLDREAATLTMTKNAIEDVLTDRQQEVLALAYHAGYFESPRHSTGDELADALGISSPTFYQHVRKATRKIMGLLADTGEQQSTPPIIQ